MKKYLLACLLALPMAALTQQEASAGCQFCCGGSCCISFSCNNCCNFNGGCNASCQPYCGGGGFGNGWGGWGGGYPGCFGGFGGWGDGCYGGVISGSPAPASTTPAPAGEKKAYAPIMNYGVQPVGYYQAPSYWYGN